MVIVWTSWVAAGILIRLPGCKRLNYTLDTTDPQTFTEPVRLDRFWVWLPGQQVQPYNCTPL
jgi:hypothetical protein